ncbi:MAG: SUMF1/EgtB/PvdO family nonheme iron enzyme [Rubrivivax sp.]|nr:SUMF1/EgtB/PvdO family nonheme iron enzyme [Pyrinomonadaceae bacterium]
MICSQCQTQNSDSARFCNNCGATLAVSQSADDLKTLTSSNENAATVEAEKKDKLIGRTLEGRYRIDSLIGLGGMGSVYRVTRLLIGDEVAMKILHSERVADPHVGERFRREAQAAARLKHPNAVSIYDFGITSDGLQYLVMELLEGLSLRQIIKQEGSLPPSVAAEITTQVCAALDEAHRRHIVHRDIKPDNIIINSTFAGLRVKVLDFGIAKLRDDVASHLTQTGSVMGTPHYMSPEQCLGEELDSRADIYSMGIVLYEMLCGRVPFNSPVSTAVVVQHVNQPPQSLRTINTGISPQVEAVVFHALEKQREARPPTASALAQELTAAVHPARVQTPSHSTWPQVSGPLQPPTHVADETVVRSVVRTPTANEMPATVHLPAVQASGATPSVRSTVPSGTLGITKINQRSLLTIGAAVFGVILLVAVVAMIVWSRKPNDVAGLNKGDKSATNPTPPPGMAYVPGNEFTMGNNAGDESERPQHKVTVNPFFIDINEVTREDYEKFVSATGHRAPAGWVNGHYPPGTAKWPVTGVDWDDANAYAKSVGKRLPTEEEWEAAARGTDGRRYPWGNEWSKGLANADSPQGGFSAVGSSKGASPYGLFDMVGNAWEWTAGDFVAYPGGSLPGQATGKLKVIRGGCFLSRPDQATTTIRVGWPARGGDEYDNTGFRCAKDISATSESVEAPNVVATPTPLVVNPQREEGGLGYVTFSQKDKTLFYFDRKSKKGKITINGTDYVLSKLSYVNNGAYKLSGEQVIINTSKAKYEDIEGADCGHGTLSTVTITLNGVSTTIRNVELLDCPDVDF